MGALGVVMTRHSHEKQYRITAEMEMILTTFSPLGALDVSIWSLPVQAIINVCQKLSILQLPVQPKVKHQPDISAWVRGLLMITSDVGAALRCIILLPWNICLLLFYLPNVFSETNNKTISNCYLLIPQLFPSNMHIIHTLLCTLLWFVTDRFTHIL